MFRNLTITSFGFAAAIIASASLGTAAVLVSDNFNDGNFNSGPAWTVAGSSGGTWSVVSNALELNNAGNLGTFDYHPVPHYIETTFAQTALNDFSATAKVGFRDIGSATANNNALGLALLDAAGTSGYSVEFSSNPDAVGGWFGMNVRRVANGVYVETIDVDGRLAEIANGFRRTRNPDGTVATEVAATTIPDDNRFDLTFTRVGNVLSFTMTGTNLGSETETLTVTDQAGALQNVARLRLYGNDPGYGFIFDDVLVEGNIVPEPASLGLLSITSGWLLSARRLRRE